MNIVKAVNILDSIVPISRFNKGEANKIFNEVKTSGIRMVVKNNTPECFLISSQEYQNMIEQYEDVLKNLDITEEEPRIIAIIN
jgi:antitoxin StbD